MDKHKALIERLSRMLEPTLFGPDAEALLDKWAGKEYDKEAAWRTEIRHGMNLGLKRDMTRGFAKTILNAVYEALKEPSEEMVEEICAAHTRARWPEDFDKTAQALRRDDAILGWVAALSSSPLGKGE